MDSLQRPRQTPTHSLRVSSLPAPGRNCWGPVREHVCLLRGLFRWHRPLEGTEGEGGLPSLPSAQHQAQPVLRAQLPEWVTLLVTHKNGGHRKAASRLLGQHGRAPPGTKSSDFKTHGEGGPAAPASCHGPLDKARTCLYLGFLSTNEPLIRCAPHAHIRDTRNETQVEGPCFQVHVMVFGEP